MLYLDIIKVRLINSVHYLYYIEVVKNSFGILENYNISHVVYIKQ